jgi:hypothetical protein
VKGHERNTGAFESNGVGITSRVDDEEEGGGTRTRSEARSLREIRMANWIKTTWQYELVVDRGWPAILHIFSSSFPEESKERSFKTR